MLELAGLLRQQPNIDTLESNAVDLWKTWKTQEERNRFVAVFG